MIRKCLKKAAALAAALMMALMFIPAGAYAVYAADVGNTVVVGVNADYGISAVGGNYTGYAFDFLREIQKRSDLTFTFVEGTAPDGRAVLTQRNKFAVGDTLELVTNAAPPVTFTAQDLRDADGLPLESVPHPMQRFTMPLPCRAAPLSLVRRKLPAETVDIRLECGKI